MIKFFKSQWGTLTLWALALVLAGGILLGIYLYTQYQLPKFHDVTVELGTNSLTIQDFMTQHAKAGKVRFVSDVSVIDLNKVGDTSLTLKHGRKRETVLLRVQDTTAPTVEFQPQRTEGPQYVPVPEDFILSISDLSHTTAYFLEDVAVPEQYTDLRLTLVVEDSQGNKTQQQCTVTYTWMREQVNLELGQPLTKTLILMDAEKDGHLLDQAALDEISAAGVGEYTLSAVSGESTATCKIIVADTTAPTLELKKISIYSGGAASLNSFIAKAEDVSGDVELELLTTLDRHTLGTYTVQIRATDIHGNTVTKETTLAVVTDTTPPKISGLSAMSVKKNSTPDYIKGVSARDGKDGPCTVSYDDSAVDLTKMGTYYVTYTSTDKSGNTATSKRKITVEHDAADTAALVAKIAQARPNTDPKSLRDYVRKNFTYTHNWGGDDPVWYGFNKFAGNCYVHALCLKALLDYYGYQTELIWVTNQADPHYWLIINMGGTWYHIDATPGIYHAKYDELMTNEMRLETLRGRVWDKSKWPQLYPGGIE